MPERGVWVDLARFDYHLIDRRVAQDTIGLMSEGASVITTRRSQRVRRCGVISKLWLFLLSLIGSTPVSGSNSISLISPLEALFISDSTGPSELYSEAMGENRDGSYYYYAHYANITTNIRSSFCSNQTHQ